MNIKQEQCSTSKSMRKIADKKKKKKTVKKWITKQIIFTKIIMTNIN